jgi:hypothetical protein
MSYYKIIRGVRYDRSLLDMAVKFTQGRGESRISLDEIQAIYQAAKDANKITDIEWRTLQYVAQQFTLTEPAKKWLAEQFEQHGIGDLHKIIHRIVREEYGLPNMNWQVDLEEVKRQQGEGSRNFASVLKGALEAFLRWGQGQLSLAAVISRRDLAYDDSPTQEAILKSWLNQGTLILIPANPVIRASLDFDTPDSLDFQTFWIFGLHIPELFPMQFIGYVLRNQPGQHSNGYFSRKPDLETLTFRVINQYAQFTNLEWQIDPAEVRKQLDIRPGQNFGNALFYALHDGIFNGESSFSFRDFIMQEIWPDPDRSIQSYQREYIETGTLRLLSKADDAEFPVPEQFWPELDDVWVFGLEMPRRTHVRFVITASREYEDASFNDGFIVETLSFDERIQTVFSDEFGVEGLQWAITSEQNPEAEYEAQRQQFGPEWRHFAGILRQALNTVLHDYIRPYSVFNVVKEVHHDEVSEENFDTAQEFRDAIKFLILKYLKTGSLEFLPIELPDNNPVDGEPVQENWLFFLLLPDLSDHGFFIILPRWPDEGQLPYNYGVN